MTHTVEQLKDTDTIIRDDSIASVKTRLHLFLYYLHVHSLHLGNNSRFVKV